MTVCAEEARLQDFHITPQASIGLVKSVKMIFSVSPPVQSSDCRQPFESPFFGLTVKTDQLF